MVHARSPLQYVCSLCLQDVSVINCWLSADATNAIFAVDIRVFIGPVQKQILAHLCSVLQRLSIQP